MEDLDIKWRYQMNILKGIIGQKNLLLYLREKDFKDFRLTTSKNKYLN